MKLGGGPRSRKPEQEKLQSEMMTMKKKEKMAAALLLLLLLSCQMEMVEPGPADCYDACSTGCVQRDARLMARCDRKCQIKCGPDGNVAGRGGG
ncbi:hypothetical protein AAC387_Pa03g1112 [Persea americana]